MKPVDFTGRTFGRWTVLSRSGSTPRGESMWLCRCECGTERRVSRLSLERGASASCGCAAREQWIAQITKHGHSPASGSSPTYRTWAGMISRCINPAMIHYAQYGGRGIRVCDRWRSFENFLADMGEKPEDMTLDRIDTNGHYEPGNCRYVSRRQQARNRRTNHLLTYQGRTQTLTEWAEELGMSIDALHHRISAGWDVAKALTAPVIGRRRFYTCRGETHSIVEWAQISGINFNTLVARLNRGLPIEQALQPKVPVVPRKK